MTELECLYAGCESAFRQRWPDETKPLVFGDGCSVCPPIMLIGEAPGEQETLQGRPFVGKAGKNLDAFLKLMGMERSAMYVSNVVKIRPVETGKTGRLRNRAPSKDEIAFFLPYLKREIEIIQPKILVSLGNVPLKALLGETATIGDMHGTWQKTPEGFALFALYHPAAVIYRRELSAVYEQDVMCLRESMTIETLK